MPEMLESRCPLCGHVQTLNSKFVGQLWRCASCCEQFEVSGPPVVDIATDDPFPTITPDEIAALQRGAASIFDEPEPESVVALRAEPPSRPEPNTTNVDKTAIFHAFNDLDWYRCAEREFFRTFGRFCDKLLALQPLFPPRMQQSNKSRLSQARQRWETASALADDKRPPVSERGTIILADVCLDLAREFVRRGDYEFVLPLTIVSIAGYSIPGLARHTVNVLQAFHLQSLSNLLRRAPVEFNDVIEVVRADSQALRRRVEKRRNAPQPERIAEVADEIVYDYYTMRVRAAVTANDRTQVQRIVPIALPYVCRLYAERGRWKEIKAWVQLCASADEETVVMTREVGALVEDDPLASPGKATQAEFMTFVENRDDAAALATLTPWLGAVRGRLANAERLFREFRTPESNFLVIDGVNLEQRLVKSLARATESYFRKDYKSAIAELTKLPAVGDVGGHPLIREWRALVNARLRARETAETLFRMSLKSEFVLEDTAWNLSVLLAMDEQPSSPPAALQVLREYLQLENVQLYDGGAIRETSGRHILSNAGTTYTLTALSLETNNESFLIDLVVNTPRNELRMYDRLLPMAFVLAASLGDPRRDELRNSLVSLWAAGGERTQWADPTARITAVELESYVNRTGGNPLELRKVAEYLETRKPHDSRPLLRRKLAEVYGTLEQKEAALGARIELVVALGKTRATSEAEQCKAVEEALEAAAQIDELPRAALQPLESWLTRNGKREWLHGFEYLFEKKKDSGKVSATGGDAPPITRVSEPVEATPPPQPSRDLAPLLSRMALAEAIKSAQVDPEVALEIITNIVANDVDESDLVIRIANTRRAQLTDIELYLEFRPPVVHGGSRYATTASPYALRERDADCVTYETIPVHCPPEVKSVEISAALLYMIDGQRRYKQAPTMRVPADRFSAITKCNGGIPHELYFYGGMVSKNYAHTFKGRERFRDELLDCARAGNMTHFLDGIKRVGKSSICANLVYDPPPDIIAVHLDLDDYALGDERVNTQGFCQRLLRDIAAALMKRGVRELPAVATERWETEAATIVFKDFLRLYADTVKPNRILLMFDEVQALLASVENNHRAHDQNKYVRRDVLDMLSAMLNDAHRPAQLLFTASERYETVKSGGTYNVFNRVTPKNLGFLDESATGEILTAGVRNTGIRYTPEAINAVWKYLRGYPAHVQQVGDKLMERLRGRNRAIVLPQDVGEVAEALVAESVLFDYQCNRDTIGRDEATFLDAIFKGQEHLYGRRTGMGRGVPIRKLVEYAPALEIARIPSIKKGLESQQVIREDRDSDGQLVVRVNGLLMEMWLARLRDERGALRDDAFPMRQATLFQRAVATTVVMPQRPGCVVFIDFENIARDESLRGGFLGGTVNPDVAAEDFANRLIGACAAAGYDIRDKRVVAPWGIEELTPYQDRFERLGIKPVNCLKGSKNAADFALNNTLMEMMPWYLSSGVGTLLLLSADNDFAQTLTRAKTAGLKTVVWGIWKNGLASRDLAKVADLTANFVERVYPPAPAGAARRAPPPPRA